MFDAIFKKAEILRKSLLEINDNKLLKINNVEVEDTSLVAKSFVNPNLLPSYIDQSKGLDDQTEDQIATPNELEEYSKKLLQATWNIASYTVSLPKIITNKGNIENALNFMNKVPKIVDERSYRIGQALFTFIDSVMREDLEALPDTVKLISTYEVKAPVKNYCTLLRDPLAKNLEVYKLHSKENVERAGAIYKIRDARENLIREQQDRFNSCYQSIERDCDDVEKILSNFEQRNDFKDIIKTLTQKQDSLKKAQEELLKCNEQWHEQNLGDFEINGHVQKLPESIPFSMPLFHLLHTQNNFPANVVIPSWLEIFNQPKDVILFTHDIKISLQRVYKEIAETNIQSLYTKIETIKAQLEVRENIQPYLAQLEIAVNAALNDVQMPGQAIPKKSDECFKQIQEFKDYLRKFQEQTNHSLDNFAINNPPAEQMPKGILYEQAYEGARNAALNRLRNLKAEKIAWVADHISRLEKKKKELVIEEVRESSSNRSEHQMRLQKAVTTHFTRQMSSSKEMVSSTSRAALFTDNTYTVKIAEINNYYEPRIQKQQQKILGIEHNIEDIVQFKNEVENSAKARFIFLQEAKEKLIAYKETLSSYKGVYLPAEKIPQVSLMKYLEIGTDEEKKKSIAKFYIDETKTTNLKGVLSNLSNQLTHFSAVVGPSVLSKDIESLRKNIDVKLSEIEQELNVGFYDENKLPSKNAKDTKLSALKQQFWLHTQDKEKLDRLLIEEKSIESQLQAEQAQARKPWDQDKNDLDEAAATAIFHEQLERVYHEQTVTEENIFEADCKFFEIQQKIEDTLEETTRSLVNMDSAAVSASWDEIQRTIAANDLDMMLASKAHWRDSSVDELLKKTTAHIVVKEMQWGNNPHKETIKKTEEKIKRVPEELLELKEEALSHFQSLKEQRINLDQTIHALREKVNAKKLSFQLFKELAMLQVNMSELIARKENLESIEASKHLIAEIEVLENRIQQQMAELQQQALSEEVNDKKDATMNMAKKLTDTRVQLQLDLLQKIEQSSQELINKSKTLISTTADRAALAQEIAGFEEKTRNTMISLEHSEEIAEKFKSVTMQLHELSIIKSDIIPVLNQMDDIHKAYEALVMEMQSLPADMVAPALELFKKVNTLTSTLEQNTTEIEHGLVAEKMFLIQLDKTKLIQFQEQYKIDSLNLLREVSLVCKSLISKINTTPKHYAKDKKKLYNDIIAFEKTALFEAFKQLDLSVLDVNTLKEVEDELFLIEKFKTENSPHHHSGNRFFAARTDLHGLYFGNENLNGGSFGNYLQARAKAYWFRDLVSSFAAMAIGCFGYKTEAEERKEYIVELQQAFKNYNETPKNFDTLIKKINEGEKFKPRGKEGSDVYDQSLSYHLEKFKVEVTKVNEQNVEESTNVISP